MFLRHIENKAHKTNGIIYNRIAWLVIVNQSVKDFVVGGGMISNLQSVSMIISQYIGTLILKERVFSTPYLNKFVKHVNSMYLH